MNSELDKRVEQAELIIRKAGDLALSYFRSVKTLKVESKGLQDRVSKADREVEQLIRESLLALFPLDGFVGEESGVSGSFGDDQFVWVVDPIDGTDCFVHAIPVWCISIALIQGSDIKAGFVFDPNSAELFSACRDQGAICNGEPIFASQAKSITEGIVAIGFSHRVKPDSTLKSLTALLNAGGVFQRNGSAALSLAYVASGRYLGFFETHINSWDVLAGLALAREAGALSNDFLENNGLLEGNPVITAAAGIDGELREICKILLE